MFLNFNEDVVFLDRKSKSIYHSTYYSRNICSLYFNFYDISYSDNDKMA